MTGLDARTAIRVSIVSTVIGAVPAFARGRRKSGHVLPGAAALAARVPGPGTAASRSLRLVRRLR